MSTNQISKINSFLTFKIADELYAVNVSNILSILELTKITKIPRTPDYIRGVINLRGIVLPIIDLRIKFGLPATDFTANTCILVLEIQVDDESVKLGGLVDSVQEVLEIEDNDILPAPNIGQKFRSEFIEGMYRSDNGFIMILDIEKIFNEGELSVLNSNILFQDDEDLVENNKDKE
jgi:purine-binding chemotaxis protein CheW